jgi:hypothetical protein
VPGEKGTSEPLADNEEIGLHRSTKEGGDRGHGGSDFRNLTSHLSILMVKIYKINDCHHHKTT